MAETQRVKVRVLSRMVYTLPDGHVSAFKPKETNFLRKLHRSEMFVAWDLRIALEFHGNGIDRRKRYAVAMQLGGFMVKIATNIAFLAELEMAISS